MCIDDKSKERYLQRKGKVFTRLPLQDCVARINVGHHLCTTFPTIHNYPFSQFPFFRSLFIVIITIYHYLSWIYHRGSLMHDAFGDADALDIILFLLVMVILLLFFQLFFCWWWCFFYCCWWSWQKFNIPFGYQFLIISLTIDKQRITLVKEVLTI